LIPPNIERKGRLNEAEIKAYCLWQRKVALLSSKGHLLARRRQLFVTLTNATIEVMPQKDEVPKQEDPLDDKEPLEIFQLLVSAARTLVEILKLLL